MTVHRDLEHLRGLRLLKDHWMHGASLQDQAKKRACKKADRSQDWVVEVCVKHMIKPLVSQANSNTFGVQCSYLTISGVTWLSLCKSHSVIFPHKQQQGELSPLSATREELSGC